MKTIEKVKVLCVSLLSVGRPMRQRFDAMLDIGLSVSGIDYSVGPPQSHFRVFMKKALYWLFRHNLGRFKLLDLNNTNKRILEKVSEEQWDVLWLDKALTVEKSTLLQVKRYQPNCKIVGFSHDDIGQRQNQSAQFLAHLPCYDVFYTTKSYNVQELKNMGCKRCKFIDNSFAPNTHRTLVNQHSINNPKRYSVGFIGYGEPDRLELLRKLAESGIKTYVWGGGWDKFSVSHPNLVIHHNEVVADQYAKTLCSMDIALCLLRKKNRDLQTTRSIEIPACGVFMLAERTDEHMALFEEGKEAVYFSTPDDLVKKCRYYLDNPDERKRIAAAGRERCLISGYSNQDRIKGIFKDLCERM